MAALGESSVVVGGFRRSHILVLRMGGSPFAPQFDAAEPGYRVWQQLIEIGWWLVAAQCAIGIVRLLMVFETKPR
ncbi:hypothetical protein [Rhizobium sp. IBUN]|uniref:hypothetical protein n=1 Tax=Rhizobium sp. IBUN TaxID=1042326 RepID=UPI000472E526|nr:hypothetical protein [Rhizobium sp. IBUN]